MGLPENSGWGSRRRDLWWHDAPTLQSQIDLQQCQINQATLGHCIPKRKGARGAMGRFIVALGSNTHVRGPRIILKAQPARLRTVPYIRKGMIREVK